MSTIRKARDLKPGDVVINAFGGRLTVDHIHVEDRTIADDNWPLSSTRPPGVTVYWTTGLRSAYRLDAEAEVDQ